MAVILDFPGNSVYGVVLHLQARFALGYGSIIKTILCFGPFDHHESLRRWNAALKEEKKRMRIIERDALRTLSRRVPDAVFTPLTGVTIRRTTEGCMPRHLFDPRFYIAPGDPVETAHSLLSLILHSICDLRDEYEILKSDDA